MGRPSGSVVSEEQLVDELAREIFDLQEAGTLVRRAGFPPEDVPNSKTSGVFWAEVVDAVRGGKIEGGVQAIADAVVRAYPNNEIFNGFGPRAELGSTVGDGDATPVPPGVTWEEFEAYREAVRVRYGVNRFIGFTSAFECEMAWEELYVDLVMDKAHGHIKDDRSYARALSEALPSEGKKVSLDEAFRYAHENGRRALVMLGDPGSGKSTQLQQALLRVLDPERGPASLDLPEGTVPMLAALQDFPKVMAKQGGEPDFEVLVAGAAAKRLGGVTEDFVARLLKGPRVLVLLDGLDEIPDAKQRARVSMMIAAAHEDGPPEHHMLVSSRYAGYADVKRVHLGNAFLELGLRLLDDAQVDRLVQQWYRAVESHDAHTQERAASDDDADRRAQALLRRIRSPEFAGEDRLVQMARTPLLLTALC